MRKGAKFSICAQQPQASVQYGNPLSEQEPCWKGHGGNGVLQAEHKPAALSYYKQGKWCTSVH